MIPLMRSLSPISPRRAAVVLGLLVAAVIVALLVARPVLGGLGRWLIVSDPIENADLIVVLGGQNGRRVVKAAELYEAGRAPRIAITGPDVEHEAVDEPATARWLYILDRVGVSDEAVVMLAPSHSTFDDATLMRDFMTEEGLTRAIVVTDPYHTRRSSWVIRRRLAGSGIDVRMVPCYQRDLTPDRWWSDESQFLFVIFEYLKFGYYTLNYGWSGPLTDEAAGVHAR